MEDKMIKPKGYLRVYENEFNFKNPEENLLYGGDNAISFRAKSVMSRIIGGGATGAFTWGTSPLQTLRVTGIALGNGGHLIYNSADGDTGFDGPLPKGANPIVLNPGGIAADTSRPATPNITAPSPGEWGYNGVVDQFEPGPTYERVENGNVPWDGTINIRDNNIGVTQPNTTLYSETLRIPLDPTDGIRFISETEVQFKATLTQGLLNNSTVWGFAQQQANLISEAGLITGFIPADGNTNQLYSNNGGQPDGSNFASGIVFKDSHAGTTGGTFPSYEWGSLPPDSFDPDNWTGGDKNDWNMIARKTFPALTKTSSFSLVFVWTVGF